MRERVLKAGKHITLPGSFEPWCEGQTPIMAHALTTQPTYTLGRLFLFLCFNVFLCTENVNGWYSSHAEMSRKLFPPKQVISYAYLSLCKPRPYFATEECFNQAIV